MKVLEDLNIVVTKDYVEGKRINRKIPIVLSEPYEYTTKDLVVVDDNFSVNSIFLNGVDNLVVALDFSCSILFSGWNDNPKGIILHGDEEDVIKLLSGLFGKLFLESVQLQRIVRGNKRAILNIYREAFKSVNVFDIEDKEGVVHTTSIVMDLDNISYSADTGANLDEFFKLLHPCIVPIKTDFVYKLELGKRSEYTQKQLWFLFGGVKYITRDMLSARKTYSLFYDTLEIGEIELFGRCVNKQLYIKLIVTEVFDVVKLTQLKEALQNYILSELNGWTVVLDYVKDVGVMAENKVEVVEVEEIEQEEPQTVLALELELEEDEKPIFLNFTETTVKVPGHVVVDVDERCSLVGATGAIVTFDEPAETFALINEMIDAGLECIYYIQDGELRRYRTKVHLESVEFIIDAVRGNSRNNRFGFLTEGMEDRSRHSISQRREYSFRGDSRRRRHGRN